MSRQVHTPLAALGSKASDYSANAADLTMTAADAANFEQVAHTGKELIIAHNTGAGARTITIESIASGTLGRSGDITTYSIGAGEIAVFGPFQSDGWRQSGSLLHFKAEHAEVELAVVTFP